MGVNKQNQLDLNGKWTLYYYSDEQAEQYKHTFDSFPLEKKSEPPSIDATVPGNFVLDLQQAGRIDDPYIGKNMLSLEKYEYYHFIYIREFEYSQKITGLEQIHFDGVDTFSTIVLNGVPIGKTDNMLIEYVFPAVSLCQGKNWLVVHIEPAALKARENKYCLSQSTFQYNYDALTIRKSTSMYGWDILPRMLSGGIWRGVTLREKQKRGFSQAYLYTENLSPDHSEAKLIFFYDLELQREAAYRYTVEIKGQCGSSMFEKTFRIWGRCGKECINLKKPVLWWVRGYGEPSLYDVKVRLYLDGQPVDEQQFQTGIRMIKLHRTGTLDEHGNGEFCFEMNGKRLFLLGTNWVPADAHPSLADQRAVELLQYVEDIGCNAIRIWGGGHYEQEAFYNICDQKGIFVWQDFMMACGTYAHTESFRNQLTQEIVCIVRRLRNHPCIGVWAGDNECDQNYRHLMCFDDPNQNIITREWIRQILLNEDYTRPYLPSSPYLDEECYQKGITCGVTEDHIWGERKYYKAPYYARNRAIFASEIGYHGCPSPRSLSRFIHPEHISNVSSEEWLLHASSPSLESDAPFAYRNRLMERQVEILFGERPKDLTHFALASQISQAEAMQFFIQHFRCQKGRCTGVIWWNLSDGWPQISDAVMDYYNTRKLAYWYIQRCQQPVCLMLKEHEGFLYLIGVNDTQQPQEIQYSIHNAQGKVITRGNANLPTDKAMVLDKLPFDSQKELWKIIWNGTSGNGENSFLTGVIPYSLEAYIQQAKALGLLKLEGFEEETV